MSERLTYYDDGKARFRIGDTEYGGAVADKLAAYEDAEEQGKLIRVPEKFVAARGRKHTLLNILSATELLASKDVDNE